MEHKLPELPYNGDALAPHISAETIDYHYGKPRFGNQNRKMQHHRQSFHDKEVEPLARSRFLVRDTAENLEH